MAKFDWKKTLGAVAPGLANIIGGPLAGMATTAICEGLGLNPGAPETEIEKALQNMTPEQAVKLKEIESTLASKMKELDVDIYKIDAADRDSARNMRIATGDRTTTILAVIVVVGWICIQFILFTADSVLPNETILLRTMGTLDAALMVVLYFFFGSSSGSKKKTEHMANGKK